MSIQNKVVLDNTFNIESQTAETYKPFGNVSNVIELVAPTISDSAVVVSFKLPNQVLVSKRPMQLEEINVDSEARNRYTYAIPSAPLSISSNQSTPLKTIITEISFINPKGNVDLGYTNKIGIFNKPSLLPTTATIPDLQVPIDGKDGDYATVLFEEDGTTPNGFIYQYTALDTWTITAFKEAQKLENSTEIEFSVEAGFDVGLEPIDITTDTLILDQQADLQSDIIIINDILGVGGVKLVPRELGLLPNLIDTGAGTGTSGQIYVKNVDQDIEGYITIGQLIAEIYDKVAIEGYLDDNRLQVEAKEQYSIPDLLSCLNLCPDVQRYEQKTIEATRRRLKAIERLPLFSPAGVNMHEVFSPDRISVLLLRDLDDNIRSLLVAVLTKRIMQLRSISDRFERLASVQYSKLQSVKDGSDAKVIEEATIGAVKRITNLPSESVVVEPLLRNS